MIAAPITFTEVDPKELTFNNLLSKLDTTLTGEAITLGPLLRTNEPVEDVLHIAAKLDTQPLSLFVSHKDLQKWLSKKGYQFDIEQLPVPLLEALIEKILSPCQSDIKKLLGDFLVVDSLELNSHRFLKKNAFWCNFEFDLDGIISVLAQVTEPQARSLINHFKPKVKSRVSNIPMSMTLSLGTTTLLQDEYLNLEAGDVVFFSQCYFAKQHRVRLDIEQHAVWVANLNDQMITIEKPWSHNMSEERLAEANEVFDLKTIKVELDFTLPSQTLPLPDVQSLQPGHVFESQCNPDSPILVKVNNQVIAHGELVKIGEKLGVRVLELAER